jgi:hypothetical protein
MASEVAQNKRVPPIIYTNMQRLRKVECHFMMPYYCYLICSGKTPGGTPTKEVELIVEMLR